MELVELMYRYINKFINSDVLLGELKSIDFTKYSNKEKEDINQLIIEVENIKKDIPNELDEIEKNRLTTIERLMNGFEQARFSNVDDETKAFADKQYNQLVKDKGAARDGGKLFEELFKLITNNSTIVKYATKMNAEELLEFITNYIWVPLPPAINQNGFNDLVKAGIKKDKRESLWRLAFNYSHKNMDFSLIEDYFIAQKDGYYLMELISSVEEDLDINNTIKKVINTKDKEFMNDCANRAIKLGLITNEDIKKIVASNYTYEEFKRHLEENVANGGEPEYSFLLDNKKYMIIGLKNSVTFQRFGDAEEDNSREEYFKNIDELYNTETIDGILLKRDWDKIKNLDDYLK